MPKIYTVNAYRSISNSGAFDAYAKLAGPAIISGGGRILARGLPLATFEAGLPERTVIVEWDSLDAAVGLYKSDAYREALACLGNAAVRDIRIIEGAS